MLTQPISVDPNLLANLLLHFNPSNSEKFHFITKPLEKFHAIYIDDDWLVFFNELKSKCEPWVQNYIDQIIKKKLRYTSQKTTGGTRDEKYVRLAELTPDKLLLSDEILSPKSIKKYKSEEFYQEEHKPNCILFRIPKSIRRIKSGYSFKDFGFLAPYIRNAKKIEIMDKQLFKDHISSCELEILTQIISFPKNLLELQLHWEPNNISLNYTKFKNFLSKNLNNVSLLNDKTYRSRSKDHDRFIVVNDNELSIRFTCSFNNFYNDNKTFIAKAGFMITYEWGRSYEN